MTEHENVPQSGETEPTENSDAEQVEVPEVASESQAEGESLTVDDTELEKTALDLAAERLEDLQRLTAEYKNFRRRTEENRAIERERALGEAGRLLFPVLDDLELAEKHGDLAEGSAFATIAGKIRTVAETLGIQKFGVTGDEFDPNQHDAVVQQPSADVTVSLVGEVVAPGYRLGSTLLRAAQVVVLSPAE